MGPKKGADGKLVFALPMGDKKLPGIAAEDIGRCALGVFGRGKEFIGKRIGIAGEFLTGQQMAAALAETLDQAVRYEAVPHEVYRGLGFPGADDLGNMFQFKHDFESVFCGNRDLALSKSLNPRLQNFAVWLGANKAAIPIG